MQATISTSGLETRYLLLPPAAFQPFFHPQTAPKSTFLEKLILSKIIKITATKCPILKLKCAKFDFG